MSRLSRWVYSQPDLAAVLYDLSVVVWSIDPWQFSFLYFLSTLR